MANGYRVTVRYFGLTCSVPVLSKESWFKHILQTHNHFFEENKVQFKKLFSIICPYDHFTKHVRYMYNYHICDETEYVYDLTGNAHMYRYTSATCTGCFGQFLSGRDLDLISFEIPFNIMIFFLKIIDDNYSLIYHYA